MFKILMAMMQGMEDVNRGKGMTFHPITGKRLSDCGFDEDRGVFVRMEAAVVPEQKFLPPILGRIESITIRWDGDIPSAQIGFDRGDWRFDPETGMRTDGVPARGLWEQD